MHELMSHSYTPWLQFLERLHTFKPSRAEVTSDSSATERRHATRATMMKDQLSPPRPQVGKATCPHHALQLSIMPTNRRMTSRLWAAHHHQKTWSCLPLFSSVRNNITSVRGAREQVSGCTEREAARGAARREKKTTSGAAKTMMSRSETIPQTTTER